MDKSTQNTVNELADQIDNFLVYLSTLTSPLLTQDRLIKVKKADQELTVIVQHASSEQEARDHPVCYFMKNDILMQKWRSPMSHLLINGRQHAKLFSQPTVEMK